MSSMILKLNSELITQLDLTSLYNVPTLVKSTTYVLKII